MASPFAAPSCSIEVYPFEGGPYVIDPGQLREVVVEKSIRGGSVGKAEIRLAPGGPYGPESPINWTQIITPMSHVLIGLSRGDRAAVVMDGVSIQSSEEQEWATTEQGATAGRLPTVEVSDFAWFFRSFNYYALTFFGLLATTQLGNTLGYAPVGVPASLNKGLLGGTVNNPSSPIAVASGWFNEIMAGSSGILGRTFVPYKSESRVPFGKAVGTLWENYPDVFIPYGDYYLASEDTWMEKFMAILPFPWYEFFVTTAPSGSYTLASGATGVKESGVQFKMESIPLALPGGAQLVGRVNPIPTLSINIDRTSPQGSTIGALDVTRWNALPLNEPDPNIGFYDSRISFDSENARNFYLINPTIYNALIGNNNASNVPFPFLFGGAADPASAHRYGYRPQVGTFRWFFDPQGAAGQLADLDIPQSVATMLAKLISWHHPSPLMATASVTYPLMPDVLIGTRFRYAPFKDGVSWDFYIEAVRHHFIFGGTSTTTLSLSRGLPAEVYADPSDAGLLHAIYVGNAMRKSGKYFIGLPEGTEPSLTTFGPPESINELAGNMAAVFVTPQRQ